MFVNLRTMKLQDNRNSTPAVELLLTLTPKKSGLKPK
jgi:hypothetical protein